MEKKKYVVPNMIVVELKRQAPLICTSDPDPYDPDKNPAPQFDWDEEE